MGNSQGSRQQKTAVRKTARKTSEAKAQDSLQEPKKKVRDRPAQHDAMSSPTGGHILTQEEFQARVAQKAFELYLKRQAVTADDDWLEAEQLVRLQVLTEERGTPTV
ncbi:MAG TPA: hypothetical protein DCQ94_21015 [Nitrospira sp.]|jgi:hypothetical protein|nr:hypothetical protein [Nitrospira sp.]